MNVSNLVYKALTTSHVSINYPFSTRKQRAARRAACLEQLRRDSSPLLALKPARKLDGIISQLPTRVIHLTSCTLPASSIRDNKSVFLRAVAETSLSSAFLPRFGPNLHDESTHGWSLGPPLSPFTPNTFNDGLTYLLPRERYKFLRKSATLSEEMWPRSFACQEIRVDSSLLFDSTRKRVRNERNKWETNSIFLRE